MWEGLRRLQREEEGLAGMVEIVMGGQKGIEATLFSYADCPIKPLKERLLTGSVKLPIQRMLSLLWTGNHFLQNVELSLRIDFLERVGQVGRRMLYLALQEMLGESQRRCTGVTWAIDILSVFSKEMSEQISKRDNFVLSYT